MNEDNSPRAVVTIAPVPIGAQDLTGQVFGKWTVLGFSHIRPKQKTRHWRRCWWVQCGCEFGRTRPLDEIYLLNGESKSCGCRRVDNMKKHGMSWAENRHPLYGTWIGMRHRCRQTNNYTSTRYRDRGIFVDQSWEDFAVFLKDMVASWREGLSLDRIDNDGPYSKENCRWATKSEQMNNTNGNRIVIYHGKSMTVKQLQMTSKHNIGYATVCSRLDRGWSPERTADTPLNENMSFGRKKAADQRSKRSALDSGYIQNYV